jgi:hypothetical protein
MQLAMPHATLADRFIGQRPCCFDRARSTDTSGQNS